MKPERHQPRVPSHMIASMYSIPLRWRYVTRGVHFYVAACTSLLGHSRWSQMVPIVARDIVRHGLMTWSPTKRLRTPPDAWFINTRPHRPHTRNRMCAAPAETGGGCENRKFLFSDFQNLKIDIFRNSILDRFLHSLCVRAF